MIFPCICSLVLLFLYSGIESGITSINRILLRQKALKGIPEAAKLDKLLEHPARLMATVVLLTTCFRILAVSLLFGILADRLPPLFAAASLLGTLPFVAFFFEFIPKVLFRRFAYQRLLLCAGILWWSDRIMAPFSAAAKWLSSSLFRANRFRMKHRLANVTEVRRATNRCENAGVLTPIQKHIVHSILSARNATVSEMAIAPESVFCVPFNEKISRVFEGAKKHRTDWVPVLQKDGQILGFLHSHDLLLDGISSGSAQSYAKSPVAFDPETRLLEALLQMRAAHAFFATIPGADDADSLLPFESLIQKILLGHDLPDPTPPHRANTPNLDNKIG